MNNSSITTSSARSLPTTKPIRFVANTEGPYAKRRRINSACTTCRRRKTRCSGERPVCQTCLQNNHSCGGYGDGDPPPYDHASDQKEPEKRSRGSKDSPEKHVRSRSDIVSRPPIWKQASPETTLYQRGGTVSRTYSESAVHPEEDPRSSATASLASETTPQTLSFRNRMPYFRYFGPTAIMPGFKQMVVKVRGKQTGTGSSSDFGESSSANGPSMGGTTPSHPEPPTPAEIPVYDGSTMSPSPLITHLCHMFFAHVGCNFPFLQEDRFMKDLEEKQVDAILVDAVCAMGARFSTDPFFTRRDAGEEGTSQSMKLSPSEHGTAFAQRAHSIIVDTFSCPSVAVVQAALLLAYNEFGASRDSGLWMYLGIAIRMAQDLGMHTVEGLRYEGLDGPSPKNLKSPLGSNSDSVKKRPVVAADDISSASETKDWQAVERERLDTFWAVFFLDRVISSGTGRPVTLRDRDIEVSFPSLDEIDHVSGWQSPFPALIRVIHLYGRVTDLLNSIKTVSHVTPDVIKRLGTLETALTDIYQNLSTNLHFNAVNFQQYFRSGQGTNFVLLHIWFHTLIVLLHQPTLLKTFEDQIQRLLPNSRELSMSSAKTVADILVFAEIIDAKSALGNPFTSQPIYISACAFLKETALHTASSHSTSRSESPSKDISRGSQVHDAGPSSESLPSTKDIKGPRGEKTTNAKDPKQAAKHTLLARAAKESYERCYKALQSLETYWSGVKYILTVLDQKATGVGDPLLYTREEMDSSLELPRPEPTFTSPGWRRKLSWGTYLAPQSLYDMQALRNRALGQGAPRGVSPFDPSQAIGWSLTGMMNSPSTSLAVLYSNENQRENNINSFTRPQHDSPHHHPSDHSLPRPKSSMSLPSIAEAVSPIPTTTTPRQNPFSPNMPPPPLPPGAAPPYPPMQPGPIDPVLVSDADLLLNLHSPFSTASSSSPRPPSMSGGHHNNNNTTNPNNQHQNPSAFLSPLMDHNHGHNHVHGHGHGQRHAAGANVPNPNYAAIPGQGPGQAQAQGQSTSQQQQQQQQAMPFGNMMIESQDIDMSALGDDLMPWLEYLPTDMMGGF